MTHVSRTQVDQQESIAAQRRWWDAEAVDYYADHGDFLGDADFVWGPEGWTEAELGVLTGAPGVLPAGPVLEIGAGAGQCGRWLRRQGVDVVSTDLSLGMVRQGAAINRTLGVSLPLLQCDGARLPFGEGSFGAVFTAYGVVPFVADPGEVMREAARVLRPGGRFAFSTSHPIRWAFPDVPGEAGLTAHQSYFDTRAYAERDDRGRLTYVEHHRSMGQRIRDIVSAGLRVVDVIEPEWPDRNADEWGGWSPLRGRILPGTAIFVTEKPRG